MASIFLNTFAPVGEAIFVQDAVEHGRSGKAPGVLLVLAVDLGTSLPFIAVGMTFLKEHAALPFYDIVASVLFFLVVFIFVAALWLGNVRKCWLESFLGWARRVINRVGGLFRRPDLVSHSWVGGERGPVLGGLLRHRSPSRHPGESAGPRVGDVVRERSRTLRPLLGVPSTGRCRHDHERVGVSIVLYVIAVTPHGVGAAEGVMSLLFTSTGVPGATAVVVAIGYRIFNVWIPVVVGYFFTRRMRVFKGTASRRHNWSILHPRPHQGDRTHLGSHPSSPSCRRPGPPASQALPRPRRNAA